MNTKVHLYILGVAFSIGLLLCAVGTHGSPNKRRKNRPDAPKLEPKKLSITGYSSISRTPSDRSSVFRPRTKGSHVAPGSITTRAVSAEKTRADIQSDFAYVPDVSVTCSTSDFVLRVKPGFYGLGADADELTLGSTCRSNGVLRPYGDLLFTYPLTACDAVRQRSSHDYLIYKYALRYEPSPKRFPSRAQPMEVDVECRYPRNHHVYQLSVQPTWKTDVVHKRLKSLNNFRIELMDGSWSGPVSSQVYQLGNKINFQVSAHHLSFGEKIYIKSCYAEPSSGSPSPLKYMIIDHFGCMLDSKVDPGSSQFVSRTDRTLRFSLKAFQFTSDPETEVNLHCTLFVTSEDPGPAQKSCTYRDNRWTELTGVDSVCECCDSRCVTTKSSRATVEGSVSSGSLLVSDQPIVEDDGFLPMTSVSVSREGEATLVRLTDLHSHDTVPGRADLAFDDDGGGDKEEQQPDRGQSAAEEPHLEDLVLAGLAEDKTETFSNEFEDYGSGSVLLDGYLESDEGEGGVETEMSEEQEEAVEQMVPADPDRWAELQQKDSKEKKTKSASELKMQNNFQLEDVGEDGRKTWYFWKK